MEYTTADLDFLIDRKQPVYVINTSGNNSVTLVLFNNPATGEVIPHEVPAQKIPWCLSDYLSLSVIGASSDLRKYVADGNLAVLNPKYAAKMAETPRVARTLAQLRAAKKALRGKNQSASVVNRKVIELDPRVEHIIARLTANDMSVAAQKEAINSLELISGSLEREEFAYIMQHTVNARLLNRWVVEEMGSEFEGVEVADDARAKKMPSQDRNRTKRSEKRTSTPAKKKAAAAPAQRLNSSQRSRLLQILESMQ